MSVVLRGAFTVVEADSGARCVELAREIRPSVIVLDVMLPQMSGLEVLRELRRDPSLTGTPVLVVTAWATEGDRLTAVEAGADAFIAKPFDPEELLEGVAWLVRLRSER